MGERFGCVFTDKDERSTQHASVEGDIVSSGDQGASISIRSINLFGSVSQTDSIKRNKYLTDMLFAVLSSLLTLVTSVAAFPWKKDILVSQCSTNTNYVI